MRSPSPFPLHSPQGVVSSLNAIVTTVIGLHYGHVITLVKGHAGRIRHWAVASVAQVVLGAALHASGVIAMNTDLYSIS